MTYYATADEIIDAMQRCANVDGLPIVGTYRIIGSWIGGTRVWMAERIQETRGYEVAYQAAFGEPHLNLIQPEHDRWGYWEEEGIVFLDRTVHIDAPGGVALDIARMYSQEAVYSWDMGMCVYTHARADLIPAANLIDLI